MTTRPQSDIPREHLDHGHQADQTAARSIAVGVFALLLFLGLVHVFIFWLMNSLSERPVTSSAPREVVDSSVDHWRSMGADLRALRARSDRLLNSTAWLNDERSFARIPIDEAMAIIAKNGIAPYPQAADAPPPSSTVPTAPKEHDR